MESANATVDRRAPWNKGKLTGQKPPLKLREIWAIRIGLYRCCSGIRSWNAQFAIWESRSTMLSRLLNKPRFDASRPASDRLPAINRHSSTAVTSVGDRLRAHNSFRY